MDLGFVAANCRAEVSEDNTTILLRQSELACRVNWLVIDDFSGRGRCHFAVNKGLQNVLILDFYEYVVGFYVYRLVNRFLGKKVHGHTRMYDLRFCVKVIEREEHL